MALDSSSKSIQFDKDFILTFEGSQHRNLLSSMSLIEIVELFQLFLDQTKDYRLTVDDWIGSEEKIKITEKLTEIQYALEIVLSD